MSGDRVVRYPVQKSLSALGVNVRAPQISADPTLDDDAMNLSTGLRDGIGPRFGMAPIPNHSTWETPEAGYIGGLAFCEEGGPGTGGYADRRKVFGVFQGTLGDFNTAGSPQFISSFIWLVSTKLATSTDFIDCVAGQTSSNRPVAEISSGLADGSTPNTAINTLGRLFFYAPSNASWQTNARTKISFATTRAYASVAQIVVSGTDIKVEWILGEKRVDGSATVPCTACFSVHGFPSTWSTRQFNNNNRSITIYDLDATNGLQYQFKYVFTSITTALSTSLYGEAHWMTSTAGSTANTAPASLPAATAVTTRLDGAASSAASVDVQLINDSDNTINTGYSLYVAATGKNPAAFMTKPWLVNDDNAGISWPVDLTSDPLKPSVRGTGNLSSTIAGTSYTEDGAIVNTCFNFWPSYASGTALGTNAAVATTGFYGVTLGAANSGILRANTDYEFTYALFNKLTGKESNVGPQARFRTGSDDYVALSILRDATSTGMPGGTPRQRVPWTSLTMPIIPLPVSGSTNLLSANALNYLEIRMYYRASGSFEWLPALFIDAAKFASYPNFNVLWACSGAIAALPGGQPGGFNDYSPLPLGDYIDVVEFQNRLFWLTAKSLHWSYKNNPFAYAGRNSSASSVGLFRGLKVHVYKGEREEKNSSRLFICASDAIYAGRFTGEFIEQPVQVSPDTIESYPQEGSDFKIEFWTSFTSFSGRSMVIADGNIYYWGPNGVFADEGLGDPRRISGRIEPKIFDEVDNTKTDQVFAVYSDATHEVFWFYPQRGGNGTTTGVLSFNVDTREFLFGEIAGQVDAGQSIQVTREAVDWKGLSGQRSLLFVRADSSEKVQRAYYFDHRCRSGDVRPFADMLAYSATLVTANQWRFRLVQGSNDNTNFATIAAGDYIAFPQFDAYTRSYADNTADFIGTVIATGNDGTRNYIDVNLPSSITLDAASPVTFPSTRCPPLMHVAAAGTGLNGFSWRLPFNYWAPAGVDVEAFWKYLHLIFKVNLIASRLNVGYTLGVQTPLRPVPFEVDLRLRDNFDGHDQTYCPIHFADSAVQSQALKPILSGVHIGSEWVLQYLAVHGTPTGLVDFLKQFEPQKA